MSKDLRGPQEGPLGPKWALFSCRMALYGPKRWFMIRAYRCVALDTPLAYIRNKKFGGPQRASWGQNRPFCQLLLSTVPRGLNQMSTPVDSIRHTHAPLRWIFTGQGDSNEVISNSHLLQEVLGKIWRKCNQQRRTDKMCKKITVKVMQCLQVLQVVLAHLGLDFKAFF